MAVYSTVSSPCIRLEIRQAKPIQRIKEALTEIKQVSKKEPVLAAEDAVLFLENIACP
jgi:hypothetical protein